MKLSNCQIPVGAERNRAPLALSILDQSGRSDFAEGLASALKHSGFQTQR
jgi:hypothetical protein